LAFQLDQRGQITWSLPDGNSPCTVLVENQISGLPIVDDENKLVGIVTEKDLLSLIYDFHANDVTLDHYATQNVISLTPDQSLVDAVDIFESNRLRRLPVVDENSRLIGILARRDLIRFIQEMRKGISSAIEARKQAIATA
jgi:predicted transcriptional regulator